MRNSNTKTKKNLLNLKIIGILHFSVDILTIFRQYCRFCHFQSPLTLCFLIHDLQLKPRAYLF